mmetsp:Transcript_98797/g.285119  ORF Transcript_98797/g.285119 Transcript_98797/m.285119 type:complete len:287 (-) Transcript_98797:226-1086(-)
MTTARECAGFGSLRPEIAARCNHPSAPSALFSSELRLIVLVPQLHLELYQPHVDRHDPAVQGELVHATSPRQGLRQFGQGLVVGQRRHLGLAPQDDPQEVHWRREDGHHRAARCLQQYPVGKLQVAVLGTIVDAPRQDPVHHLVQRGGQHGSAEAAEQRQNPLLPAPLTHLAQLVQNVHRWVVPQDDGPRGGQEQGIAHRIDQVLRREPQAVLPLREGHLAVLDGGLRARAVRCPAPLPPSEAALRGPLQELARGLVQQVQLRAAVHCKNALSRIRFADALERSCQ